MGDVRLAVDPVFESSCGDVEESVDGYLGGAAVRSWKIDCPNGLAGSRIAFRNLPATMIDVWVRVGFLDGRTYAGLVRPSDPVFTVPERENRFEVFVGYLVLGIEHILFGWDHLLFVLGIVLLVTDLRRLVLAITGFTVAHSITLALAMFDWVRVPGSPVEAVIALSILVLAVEVTRHRRTGAETLAIRAPWIVSMGIGLVHGLGFAGALSEYGLPAHARAVSLFAFNLGVEIGQLAFVAALLVMGLVVRRIEMRLWPPTRLRPLTKLRSPIQVAATWLIGVCGSFWLIERIAGFYS